MGPFLSSEQVKDAGGVDMEGGVNLFCVKKTLLAATGRHPALKIAGTKAVGDKTNASKALLMNPPADDTSRQKHQRPQQQQQGRQQQLGRVTWRPGDPLPLGGSGEGGSSLGGGGVVLGGSGGRRGVPVGVEILPEKDSFRYTALPVVPLTRT